MRASLMPTVSIRWILPAVVMAPVVVVAIVLTAIAYGSARRTVSDLAGQNSAADPRPDRVAPEPVDGPAAGDQPTESFESARRGAVARRPRAQRQAGPRDA